MIKPPNQFYTHYIKRNNIFQRFFVGVLLENNKKQKNDNIKHKIYLTSCNISVIIDTNRNKKRRY